MKGENLYNEDLKRRFLKQKEKMVASVDYTYLQLRSAAEQEYELDKDLCNWNSYEIMDYYKCLNMTSYDSLAMKNSIYSQYTQFCLENNLVKDNQNHYLEFTREMLLSFLNKAGLEKKIVDRKTILGWVEQLPNPRDKFVLLGVFEFGKTRNYADVANAKQSDINGNQLKLSNRTVNISTKLRTIAEECQKENVYYCIGGKGEKKLKLEDDGYIVRSYPNMKNPSEEFYRGKSIYNLTGRIFRFLGIDSWMNAIAVVDSGKLSMIKERAQELGMTPYDYIYSDHIKEVENQFDCEIRRKGYVDKYKEYLV